jgi:hypothetical protein
MTQTVMIQDKINAAKTLWASVLPGVPAPPDSTLRLWLVEHQFDAYERAIAYAPQRVERLKKNGRYDPTRVYKFISMVLHRAKVDAKPTVRAIARAIARATATEPTLLDAVRQLSPDEARDPANTVRLLNIFILSEFLSYQKANFFAHVSPATLRSIRELQETSDVKSARNLAMRIVDSLECSSLNDGEANGSALRRLAELERAITARAK